MNRLLSQDTNDFITRNCADINSEAARKVAEETARGTGRTTAILLGLIATALANPGETHRVSDHFKGANHYHQACCLQAALERLLEDLRLMHHHVSCGYKVLADGSKQAYVGLRFIFMEAE